MQTATGYSSLLIRHLVSTTCPLSRPMLNFCAMEVSGEVDLTSILSSMVKEWAGGAAVIFALGTVTRVWGQTRKRQGLSGWWVDLVPGGIAVAVGKSLIVIYGS